MKTIIKNPSNLFLLLILSAYGFYLPIGIRTDQLLVYILFLYVFFNGILLRKLVISKTILRFLILFFLFFLLSITLWIINYNAELDRYTVGQFERFFSSFSVIIITLYFYERCNIMQLRTILIKSSKLIILCSFIASLIVLQHYYTDNDTIVKYFQPNQGDLEQLTSVRSLRMGRYTGIFTSPFESGIIYSLSFFCYFFLLKINKIQNVFTFMIIVIIIASILAISKASILGFFMFAYFYIRNWLKNNKVKLALRIFLAIMLMITVTNFISKEWIGYERLVDLIDLSNSNSSSDLMYRYSGGRFTESGTGTIQNRYEMIKERMPLGGGFGDIGIVDNAYFENILICGIFGLYFLLYFFIRFTILGYRSKYIPEGYLLYIMVLFSSLASLGAPTITKNRYNVLFFGLFTLIILFLDKTKLIKQKQ